MAVSEPNPELWGEVAAMQERARRAGGYPMPTSIAISDGEARRKVWVEKAQLAFIRAGMNPAAAMLVAVQISRLPRPQVLNGLSVLIAQMPSEGEDW